ncbi:MAG: lipocalin family protein, partial [Ottowia sp.]|nr:lipocalin family protein [Ottowia sp.]
DGDIDVVNTGIKNGAPKTARGRARRTEMPALLRVSFFGPLFYSDYRVMWLGADGQCALVGSGSDQYLWILSRTPNISDETKNALLAEARRRRYDTEKLVWVAQPEDAPGEGNH